MYKEKGIQCHSNHSPQLFELKKQQQKTSLVAVTHNTVTQPDIYTYTRLTFVVSLVDNEYSSKYCCVGLIAMTNNALTNHCH